jgi:alpha-L-arabinofuranosidase
VRYPGGCFADTYHWKDGIGDRDRRPERWSPIWNEWEPNDFGIDEFMDLARELGFDVQITFELFDGHGEGSRGMGAIRQRRGGGFTSQRRSWRL